MKGWNVSLAMPEWILAGTILVVLFLDARTRFNDKGGVARVTWFGLIAATFWVLMQGLTLPGALQVEDRRESVRAYLEAPDAAARTAWAVELEQLEAPLDGVDPADEAGGRPANESGGALVPVAPETVAVLTAWAGGGRFAVLGRYAGGSFAVLCRLVFGATAMIVLALSESWLRRVDRGHGEFRLLLLMATLGMFFVSSVEDFAALFVSLELITICFYCLTAFKRNDVRSIEAGVKYVVLGGLASAFLLLGIAFIYGQTGSLLLRDLAAAGVADALGHDGGALVQFGVLLTLVGLGFKIAAVPFQVWTPDVYQGAASPVTAFLSMGSKAAGFVLLLKVVRACLGPAADAGLATAMPWIALIALLAGVTVLYGNLGAMWQEEQPDWR
jgi:NADH:ubiquinone oxidoreductase subunit 2 (subunit N)